MDIRCNKCSIVYKINDVRIPIAGAKIKCKKCGTIYHVKKKPESEPVAAPAQPKPAATPKPSPLPAAIKETITKQPAVATKECEKEAEPSPMQLFETQFKKVQRIVFTESPPNESVSQIRDSYKELMTLYQPLKKEITGKEKFINELETLIEVGQIINTVLDMPQLLNLIMDMVIKVVEAERGFLMLKDAETGELEFKVARNMDDAIKDKSLFTISSGITGCVVREGTPVLTTDAQSDERFSAQASVMDNKLRSVMCVPMMIKKNVIGSIFVDNRMLSGAFTEKSLKLLSSFANQAAIAIENARLYKNVEEETKKRSSLQRYLSPTVVNDIINKKEDIVLGGEKIECSVLFTDICGFTSLSEQLEPEEIVKMLNEYFTEMTKIIFANQGTIDKFIGDAIMAIFGAPVFTPQSAQNAVKAGIDMLAKLRELQKKWEAEGSPSFKIRVGINTGVVVAGNLGSIERMDYTVIGDNVNLASRLESNAQPMTVLISDSTYAKIQKIAVAKEMEPIKVKGKVKPVQTYEVSDIKIKKPEKAKVKREFERKEVKIFATFRMPPDTKNHQGIIQDLSGGGMLISTRVAVSIGEYLQFDFELPDKSKLSNINGKVNVVRPFKDKNSQPFFKVGIEFEAIADSAIEIITNFTSA